MKFQRIVPAPYEGATLFGISLNALHSRDVDREGLKQWVDAFANCIDYSFQDPEDGSDISYHDLFMEDLQNYCVYIAASDGPVSDAEIAAMNWLLGEEYGLDRDYADYLVGYIRDSGWSKGYPLTFQMLVFNLAGNDKDVMTAAQASFFYRQVARFIYEIDNKNGLDGDNPIHEYIGAYQKYVERVSAIGFIPPEEERLIEEVCDSWSQLVEAEYNETQRDVCGTWRGVSGNALSSGLSDFVLKEGGKGFMIKKKLFGKRQMDVTWEVVDMFGGQSPVIHIAELDADVIMTPLDSNRIAAMVSSSNSRINGTMAMYQRV